MKKIDLKLLFIIFISIIAIGNAAYLTNLAYSLNFITNGSLVLGIGEVSKSVCDINALFSCSGVFSNNFAWIFGLPFSLYALFVYPIIIIIAILGLTKNILNPYKVILAISILGFIFNLYIILNEYFAGVYCLLCLICTGIIITNGIISIYVLKKSK